MFDAPSAVHCTNFFPSSGRSGSYCRLLVLLAAALLVFPIPSAAQTTQTLSLDAGWNLVSLRVQPDDSSFASIFDSAASMAKNEDGDVYLPDQGIGQISTWRTGEGYKVYAETATTLEVSGSEVSLGATAIELEEGWNVVPFLPTGARATENALISIDGSLVVAEDEDGTQYDPTASSSPLDSLRPGQGYKVYVDRRDTLRYPRVAQTLDDGLALQGMEVGSYLQVRGRGEPGDGGGGLFRVTTSGATTDGGTVFMFDEDLTQVSGAPSIDHTNLSWRNTEVRYGPDSNDVVGMLHLSGFHQNKAGQAEPWVDLKNGLIRGGGYQPFNTWASNLGDGRANEYTYSHTNSDRRLERVVTREPIYDGTRVPAVNPRWWGAPVADPDNPKPADAYIRWAMIASSRIVANTNYDWSVVAFDDFYYYQHQIELMTGNYFKGTGPTDFDTDLEPSKYQDGYTQGGIIGLPGELLDYRLSNFDLYGGDANNREDIYLQYGDLENPQPTLDNQTARFGFEKFKVDGNVRNNMQVFNNLGDYNDVTGHLQNSGSWSGFAEKFFNLPNGTVDGAYKDLNYVDLGGSGLQQGPDADNQNVLVGENINVHDTRRNHSLYGLVGDQWDSITVEGQFWGGIPILDPRDKDISTTITNLTLKNLERGQFSYQNTIEARSAAGPSGGLTINGFTIDLRGLTKDDQFRGIIKNTDRGNEYKNGTVRGMLDGDYSGPFPPPLFEFRFFADKVQRRSLLEDVEVIDHGVPMQVYDQQGTGVTDMLIKDVTYRMANGVTPSSDRPAQFSSGTGSIDSYSRPLGRQNRAKHVNTSVEAPVDPPFAFKAGNNQSPPFYPGDTYHVGGTLNNQGQLIELNQFDTFDEFDPDGERAIRLFVDGTTVNSYSFADFHRQFRPEIQEVIRLRGVSDASGRTSDQVNQSYTATSDDESNGYALIPTNLISRAWERSVTANADYNVTSVEVANSDGTLRADDNTGQRDPYLKVSTGGTITQGDTFTWTARVTPLDRYQTSGAFIARRLYDRTSDGVLDPFTSGNGPFTINLLGVATAQDMDMMAKPTYTASSGDTSVVTASVQGDGYTLELTEQSAGTATITVTGNIPNVGTASTTFEVTVE